jgi:predicted O-linked N-acetylglucosamine transferase (SPINDLY family)
MLVDLLQSGQFDSLARHAKDCAVRWPASGPVWHLLGLAFLNQRRPDEAILPLTRASKLLPRQVDILEQLAIAQMQAGHLAEAHRSFERCLALAPKQPGLLINMAHLTNMQGKHTLAERHSQQVLRLIPGQPEALFNLARALRGQGRQQEAIAALRQADENAKNLPEAQNDIGLQLQEIGAATEAESCLRRAIALAPGYAQAYSNLGRALEQQGKSDEALAAFRRAISLAPDLPAAHANLGSLLNALRQFAEGETACRRAVQLDSGLAVGYSNLGNALLGQRHYADAEAAYRQALSMAPDTPDTCNNLGNLLQELKRYAEAAICYRRVTNDDGSALGNACQCAAQCCDWTRRAADEAALRALLSKETSCIGPFGLLAIPGDDGPAMQRRAGWLYANKHLRAELARPPLVAANNHPERDRLRIGYLSADFHEHATMHLLGGVLASHNQQHFAVHLYSYGPDFKDTGRQAALDAAEIFRDLAPLSDAAAAAQIAADGIDILVDLKGYTQDARLGITALRPAPLIVSWLGYPGTLGEERLADYLIGDPVVTPVEHAAHFSETLALLPHCYQPNDRHRAIGPCPTRKEAGLPEVGFVFCSFNQNYKFNPPVFDIWCRLLTRVPDSVLWLLQGSQAVALDNLRREAKARGVAPERLIFAPQQPMAAHLGRLQLADLALDTSPYGSHTTGSDALWAGVPMLSKTGDSFASRVGASLLHAGGLPELVVDDWDQYLALAQELAHAPGRLAALRQKLAVQRLTAPLFDTAEFTQDLEKLYRKIWAQHGEGRKATITTGA